MNLVVSTEIHFISHQDAVYTESLGDYEYWQRYLRVYDSVVVFARVRPVVKLPVGARRANGDSVSFITLPDYTGPFQGIRVLPVLMLRAWRTSGLRGAFLLRLPGIMGTLLYFGLRIRRHPYGVRVLGDPAESFSSVALQKRWAGPFRVLMTDLLRAQCRAAHCISYVTKGALQLKYPSRASFRRRRWP